jgi:hypothetical protein
VVVRPIRKRAPSRTIGLVWRRNTARQDELLEIANMIQEWLRSHAEPQVQPLSRSR